MDLEIAETEIWKNKGIRESIQEVAKKSPIDRNFVGHIESLAVMIALEFQWADDFNWQELEELCDNLIRNASMAPPGGGPWRNGFPFHL